MNISLDDYDALVYTMRATLDQIRQNIQVQKTPKVYSIDIHWEQLSRLDKMVKGLDVDLQSFRKLLFVETLPRSYGTCCCYLQEYSIIC